MAGQTESYGGHVQVHYDNGDSDTLWHTNSGSYNSPNGTVQSNEFSLPTNANQFRFSYRVRLDKGWLAFNNLKLTGWSDTIPVTGGEQYELSLLIGGEMPVPLGHGGRIRAHYPGSSADPVAVWVNPPNFNNSGKIFSQTFTPPTSANSIQFSYQVTMDKGWLAFSEAALSHLNPAYTITRKTYALGGQTIATRISGNQGGDNGLFYIHSDHLGSTSVMSNAAGQKVNESEARYLPFGDWRVEPGHELTDQAFTGQKHNMDLGLYYYNARFYLPGIGRFASADTIVPDPMNPQQFNRYTYTLNNPLRYTDPTGHYCYDPSAGADLIGTCILDDGTTHSLFTPQKEIKSGVPDIIQNATPFGMLPFDLSAYDGTLIQAFGDTSLSSRRRDYSTFGYLHPGVDVAMPLGTELLAIGDGTVVCAGGGTIFCGQTAASGGFGIGIRYPSCSCTVYYVHATDITVNKDDSVVAGQRVGVSGAGSDGYAHLHLEIRSVNNDMVYNPIYFFQPDVWNGMNLKYQGYQNSYRNPETRVYAIKMSTGFDYWNWNGSYPFVMVR